MANLHINEEAITAIRNILGDTDESCPVYAQELIVQILSEQRETIYYRDPKTVSSGFVNYRGWYGRQHVPSNEHDYSLLQAEPGGYVFTAQRFVRHWDSNIPPVIWLSGSKKVITTDYTVDYANGRITMVAQTDDWDVVNASFSYFKIYHAAKQMILLSGLSQPISMEFGDNKYTMLSPESAVKVLDNVIRDMTPQNIKAVSRVY
jgi:hypothetical protein